MQCNHAQELFSDYVTGDSDRALTVSIENHLANCTACSATVVDLRHAWAMLDQMPLVEPPPHFHPNLMNKLAAELAQTELEAVRSAERVDWRSLFRPRTLAFAATVLILLMTGAEVMQTQRAALGPLDWMVSLFRPAPAALQTARAEWTPDPATGGGTISIHLKASPLSVVAPTRFSYRLHLDTRSGTTPEGSAAKDHEGEVSSAAETMVTWQSNVPPAASPSALKVSLSPADDASDQRQQTLTIPITTRTLHTPAP